MTLVRPRRWERRPRRSRCSSRGLDVEALPPDAPAPLLFGSIPFDPRPERALRAPEAHGAARSRRGDLGAPVGRRAGGRRRPKPTRRGSEPSAPFSEMQVFPEPLPDVVRTRGRRGGRQDPARDALARSCWRGRSASRPVARWIPAELLKRLRAVEPDGYSFAVDIGEGRTLVGASPELLISRFGDEIRANPLAGSAPRAGDPSEDRRNAERLGTSPKDRQEHAIVVEDVFRALHPLCREPHVRSGARNSWPPRTCGTSRRGSAAC